MFKVFEVNILLYPIDISSTEVFFCYKLYILSFFKLKDNKLAANDSLNWINTDVISLLKTMWLK